MRNSKELQQPRTINRTQEAIRKMSPELKQFLEELWAKSVQETVRIGKLPKVASEYAEPDIQSLTLCHKKVCDVANTSHLADKDRTIFKFYRATLSNIIEHRTITALMTDFMTEFVKYLMWITIWYNHTYKTSPKIAADIIFNRKGLTPHLAKAILKNVNVVADNGYQHAIIRDLFRGSYTIKQDDVKLLRKILNIAISILTNPESEEYHNFYTWVQNSPKIFGGMRVPKANLLEFLELFRFELTFVKDYIQEPKGAYEAWQGTFIILEAPEHYSKLCAKMFEFKFWTFKMQHTAEMGEASHDEYKRELNQFIREVFAVDVNLGDIDFYIPGLDTNGLTQARNIYCRNVSVSTIPETN